MAYVICEQPLWEVGALVGKTTRCHKKHEEKNNIVAIIIIVKRDSFDHKEPCKIQCTFDCHRAEKICALLLVNIFTPTLRQKKNVTDPAF